MALTKPRAYQIFDIDYKQATRVCTVANVTLSGGAPNQVDGINLSLNDRILVTGQTNTVQNGLYYVTTLGTGSNGTWARSVDGDITGELQSGMIIMVTEGTSYADTQWKLISDNPITLGVTPLVFTLNYGVPYTVAASPPTTGNVVSSQWLDSNSGALYEYSYDGSSYYWVDITGPTVSNTSSVTGIVNGNSNIKIATANSNITVSVAGIADVAVFTTQGANITGNTYVGGALVATTKSFAIQHPDKPEIILYHGCLEGPEHAVYTRGRSTIDTIVLPDYWKNLVEPESITVHLTAIGNCDQAKVIKITSDSVKIQGTPEVDCFYIIHAQRKDVPPLTLEVPGSVNELYRDRTK